jgi:hypothetical protein
MTRKRFSFSIRDEVHGAVTPMPFLPLTLLHGDSTMQVRGLVDTGSTVNVLPYWAGIQLGAVWKPTTPVRLVGNLARFDAYPLILPAIVEGFEPHKLVFAWTRAEEAPLILGHTNFLAEFNVCFYRSQGFFELETK